MGFKQGYYQSSENALTSLHVINADPHSDPRWEELVTRLPDSLIYHHPAWLQVIEEAFNYKPAHLACEDADGQLRGIFPLFSMRGLLTGRRFSSLPRTPVAGPLAYDEQAMAVLVNAAIEQTREVSGAQLQLKMLSNTLDGLVNGVVGVPWRQTYVVELPERPELLRFGNSRSHTRLKSAVNKAARLGVEVHSAETEQELQAWYRLYLDTMRWVTVPPRPYRFFEVAWKLLRPRGLMQLLLAKHYEAGRGRLLAGSLYLRFGQTVSYAFNGWQREEQSLRPNDAIQWQAIQDACSEGFRRYDFGEVTQNNHGLAEFKSRWGGEPKWLYRYYFPAPRELEIGMLESESRASQMVNAAWRKLPIKATVILSYLAHRFF